MNFKTRQQFINSSASEKLTLVHLNGKKRLYVFNGDDAPIYSKQVPNFVVGLKQNEIDLIQVFDIDDIVEGSFYYDIINSILYCQMIGDINPNEAETIVTYRFFFSDKGIATTHNLENIADEVFYDGRIVTSPGYRHKIGIDQALTSLVGEGTLHLKNQDGGLDDIFDTIIFENQDMTIYSWNPTLEPAQRRVIYRGKVTNKTFDGIDVKIKIKDQIFQFLNSPQMEQYTEDDNVSDSVQGQFKRRVYGRVDGLKCQSVDQVAGGFNLTGTVSAQANSTALVGVGTLFLTELNQGDSITVGSQEFEIEEVVNNTSAILGDEAAFGFSGQTASVIPARGTTLKNRTYLATGHICAEVTHEILEVPQFNRLLLSSTNGLFSGDFVEFLDTSERIEIKTVAPGNILVLQQNMVTKPTVGTFLVRRPIQEVYINSTRVNASDFSIFNTTGECGLTFSSDAEFNLARPKNTAFTATFTSGSRIVTVSNDELALDELFQPGDWVKPNNISYSQYYRVVNVKEQSLEIATNFAQSTISSQIEFKSPEYLEDDTVVSVNILGKTVDNTASGTWISNASQAMKDLIQDIGITQFNLSSFAEGEIDSPQLISIAIPQDFTSKTAPTVKDVIDNLAKSTHSSLTLDNDLLIKFKTLNVSTGENIPTITDSDVIDWGISSTNGKTYQRLYSRYRFTDVDLNTLEPGNKAFNFTSEFVDRYIGTKKVIDANFYLYKQRDAEIAAHRFIYYNRLGVATLTITTDLRLEDMEIGEVVIADFQRLYKRFGDSTYRKKVMLIIGKTVNGERTELILSDLGNTFNTSSYITPNDAPEYNLATEDQKLIYGYITDNQGIVDNDEDTAGVHLIS